MTIIDREITRKQALIEKAAKRVEDLRRLQGAGLICKSGDFFPSVHYPPITMYHEISEEDLFATYKLPQDGLFDVYAHIPFCLQRCVFCHYPVQLGEKSSEKDRYLDALDKEMGIYMKRIGVDRIKARSILVGGGTPTFLSVDQLGRFLESFVDKVDISECKQFNYDVDPITLIGPEGIERLKLMRSYGVDRVTIGIQSLNDAVLKRMNRHHTAKEAIEAIKNCQEYGYQVNIEFIFGYPEQTLENWIDMMEEAIALDTEEIQLYRLKVEAYGDFQGPIKTVKERKPHEMPTLEETIMMKQLAIDILNDNGYYENLRRVFSKERKHFSHYADNQCCGLLDQLGFGLTAFSSLRDRFVLNTQNFEEYYAQIEKGRMPLNRGYIRNQEEQMRWSIVLPLKNRVVWKEYFEQINGLSLNNIFRQKIDNLKEFGVLEETDKTIGLTQLGAFFADEVAQQFHAPDYVPYPRDAYERGTLYPYDNSEP
jgi:oxygen-independent coproporphyrinogen-3 oxidase